MTTIEILPFDPAANTVPPPPRIQAKTHPLMDSAAVAVLVLLLGLFVLPMVP